MHMYRNRLHIVAVIAGLVALPSLAFAAPGIPEQFYGTVQYDSGTITSSLTINALIGGVVVATVTTQSNGSYGISPNLFIVPDANGTLAGATTTFTVNGSATRETVTFSNASLTNLTLTVVGAAPGSSLPTGGSGSSGGGGGGGGGGGSTPVTPTTTIKGDANGDNKVDKYDFSLMMANWGKTGSNSSDLNGDNKVDKYDFALLMSNWGK